MTQSALESLRRMQPANLQNEITKGNVLIVDDDPNVLSLCETYLREAEQLGPEALAIDFHTAADGAQTLAAAQGVRDRGEKVTAALLDIILPGAWDGIDTCLRLWEIDRDIQCILMTGAGEGVEEAITQRVPADLLPRCDYVGKPFTRFALVQHIRRAVHAWCGHRREEIRRGENIKLVLQLGSLVQEMDQAPPEAEEEE